MAEGTYARTRSGPIQLSNVSCSRGRDRQFIVCGSSKQEDLHGSISQANPDMPDDTALSLRLDTTALTEKSSTTSWI
jgi:hypothetical protein